MAWALLNVNDSGRKMMGSAPRLLLRVVVHLAIAIGFVLSVGDASATLLGGYSGSCGGDSSTLTTSLGTITDPAGDTFTLNCVKQEYYQGSIFVKATGKTTAYGRCRYDWGANIINFEVDANDNFKEIEWVNVNPPFPAGATDAQKAAARDAILGGLSNGTINQPILPTAAWLGKVTAYLKANNLENTDNTNDKNIIYTFPFSPNDQEILGFENDALETEFVLTPDQANFAYLDDGLSPIPNLVIDPLMRVPGASVQDTLVPEPSSFVTIVSALAGIIAFRRRTLFGKYLYSRSVASQSDCV
jgi:hypothetical protein